MKAIIFTLVVFTLCVLCNGAPIRPQISDVFYSEVNVHVFEANRNRVLNGGGLVSFDIPLGQARSDFKLENPQHQIEVIDILDRYDLNAEYVIKDDFTCQKEKVSGTLMNPFAWVDNATYDSSSTFNGKSVDTWQLVIGNVTKIISVLSDDVNTPVWTAERISFNGTHDNREITYLSWSTSIPGAWVFAVPTICDNVTQSFDSLGGDINSVIYFANSQWNCANVACSSRVPAGSGQEGYECAEFVARSLAAGGYITGLSSTAAQSAFGNYKGLNLLVTTSLSEALGRLGFVKRAATSSSVRAAAAAFGDGGDGYFSHAVIGISTSNDDIDAHNNARQNIPVVNDLYKAIDAVWGPP